MVNLKDILDIIVDIINEQEKTSYIITLNNNYQMSDVNTGMSFMIPDQDIVTLDELVNILEILINEYPYLKQVPDFLDSLSLGIKNGIIDSQTRTILKQMIKYNIRNNERFDKPIKPWLSVN